MQLPILDGFWVDNSTYYVNGAMNTERNDLIFVVIERSLKMTRYIPCKNASYDSYTTNLLFHGSCTLASSAQNNYK